MTHSRTVLRILSAASLSVAAGCGTNASSTLDGYPAGAIDTAPHVAHFAGSSAANIGVLFARAGENDSLTPASCPRAEVNGATRTITGGCTDESGARWAGSYSVVHDAASDTNETTFNGFIVESTSMCTPPNGGDGVMVHRTSRYDGVVRSGNMDRADSFHVDVVITGEDHGPMDCVVRPLTTAIHYDGTWTPGEDTNHDGHPDHYVWNGSGRIGNSENGAVSATTADEVFDGNRCNSEALSGRTTITSGGHTAVITYDGETDCSMDSTVTWTYDGVPQGTLTGVSCSVSHPGGRSRGARGVGLIALVALGCAIARHSRRRGNGRAAFT